MNRISKTMIFILAVALVRGEDYVTRALKGICNDQNSSKDFLNIPLDKVHPYDAFNEFARGRHLGKGAFGEVRKVTYYKPLDRAGKYDAERIAMKLIKPQDPSEAQLIAEEIKAMKKVVKSPHFPTIYGCVFNHKYQVLIGLTPLSHSLDSTAFRTAMAIKTIAESLIFYRAIFQGLFDLWVAGFSHCDIKPPNMMTDVDNKAPRIIDLGLVQSIKDDSEQRGTPLYMAPTKFKRGYKVAQKEDMYSVALSIAAIEAPNGIDDILYQPQSSVAYECFRKSNPLHCRQTLIKNMQKFLAKPGSYGSLQTTYTKETINFTTLLCKMVEFDNFNWTYEDVLEIMDRLISKEAAMTESVKLSAEELLKRKAQVEELTKTRKAVEQIDDARNHFAEEKQKAKKKVMDAINQSKLQLQALKKDDAVEARLKDIDRQREEALKKVDEELNKKKLDLKRKQDAYLKKLHAADEDIYKKGKVYKEHKELLIPKGRAPEVEPKYDILEGMKMSAKMFEDFEEQNAKKALLEKQGKQELQRRPSMGLQAKVQGPTYTRSPSYGQNMYAGANPNPKTQAMEDFLQEKKRKDEEFYRQRAEVARKIDEMDRANADFFRKHPEVGFNKVTPEQIGIQGYPFPANVPQQVNTYGRPSLDLLRKEEELRKIQAERKELEKKRDNYQPLRYNYQGKLIFV